MTGARAKGTQAAGVPAVILATGNRGKAREFERLLDGVLTVEPLPAPVVLPEETGETFAENARAKAEAVFAALGGSVAVLADDSGLEVEALGGRPGVQSARFAGEGATDEANVNKLLADLGDRPDRVARFVCALCLLVPGKGATPGVGQEAPTRIEAEGVSAGTITLAPRGADGFGYDPIFQPDGWTATLAEAFPGEKDRVSHRGAAARSLLAALGEATLVAEALAATVQGGGDAGSGVR